MYQRLLLDGHDNSADLSMNGTGVLHKNNRTQVFYLIHDHDNGYCPRDIFIMYGLKLDQYKITQRKHDIAPYIFSVLTPFNLVLLSEWVNIALRRFLYIHGNIARERSPKS